MPATDKAADTDNDTDADTLYGKIGELTGLVLEKDESAEDFKAKVVRHFAEAYPNTDEGNAAFEKIDDDVTDWVDEATEVLRANKGARNKKRLPELTGLDEDEAPTKRVGRGTKKTGDAAEKKERVGTSRSLASSFEPAPEGAMISKFLSKAFKANDYKREKERSKSGHIVYKKDDHEVYVGPGKGEKVYMMGWRGQEQDKHGYGGDALEEYLSKR